jgi:hypothetical protein
MTIRAMVTAMLASLAVLALSGCGGEGPDHVKLPEVSMPALPPPPAAPAHLDPAALAQPQYDAVLVSGDRSRSVDDDAIESFGDALEALGTPSERIRSLSADPKRFAEDFYLTPDSPLPDERRHQSREDRLHKIAGGTDPADPALVLRRVLELNHNISGTCLVYLASTSKGDELELRNDGSLSPEELDRALGGGCAAAPNVVVVSGCGTGSWAAGPMAKANRLILTAAAAGKKGFGCGPNVGFTTFDECFLGAIPGALDWPAIFKRTKICVERREKLVDQPSVEPQIFIGALAAGLSAPGRDAFGPEGVAHLLDWRQGIGRFSLDGVPYYSVLKQRTEAAFQAYGEAPAPKALALTLAGTVAWAAANTGSETPDDVARIALQLCEWQSDGACILYARGDGLAANGPSGFPALHPPMLARQGSFDPAFVPFIRDDQRPALAAYRTTSGAKALALAPAMESFAIGTGPNDDAARQAALAACARKGGDCLIYAEDDHVVLGYHEAGSSK